MSERAELLDIAGAAELTGRDVAELRRLIREADVDQPPLFRLAYGVRFERRSLQAWHERMLNRPVASAA